MNAAVQFLEDSLRGIHYGAITSGMIDTVRVVYYGQPTQIKHLAVTADVQGGVNITPHEQSMVGAVAKALTDAGFKAYVCGKKSVAVSASPLSGQDREKVKAQIKKLGEEAKVAVRGVRKKARQSISDTLTDDERVIAETDIQNHTHQVEAKIDQLVFNKLQSFG